jgi:hypothetical protein
MDRQYCLDCWELPLNPVKLLAHAILAGALMIGATDAQESAGPRSEAAQWAYEEWSEAIIRGQIEEQRRILPRFVPDDVRAMTKRETGRARKSILVAVVICLVLFFVFALPLYEREKPLASEQAAADDRTPAV